MYIIALDRDVMIIDPRSSIRPGHCSSTGHRRISIIFEMVGGSIGLFGGCKIARQIAMSSSIPIRALSTKMNLKSFSKNMELCTKEDPNNRDRPLVLLFEWLGAKKKHVLRYSDYYFTKGCDTMLIRIQPLPLLWPVRVQGVVDEILATLDHDTIKDRSLVVHTFSVGGYFYGELLVRITQQEELVPKYRERLLGQIFDSPVDFAGIPNGFSKAVSKNPVIRAGLKHGLKMYLSTFSEYTTKHYLRSSKACHENPLNIPSLFLYSLADPIADPATSDECIKSYGEKDIPVFKRCWADSTHCSHMLRYPEEYQGEVSKFIDYVASK